MDTDRPSRARAYFEMIKLPENGAIFLNQLVGSNTPTYESEFLEFKGAFELAANSDDIKRLWAKNLSCFANSDGGVLIFGIDAPKGKPKSLSLVQDVSKLQEHLKGCLPRITEPPVQRVEIETFPHPPNAVTGFVVCFIPGSPWRPHQVKLDGQPDQFYIRASDNCIPCSVSTLRALFAPQFVSKFEIYYHLVVRPPHAIYHWREVFLHCWLENAGPATASEVFVLCESPSNMSAPGYDHRLWKETVSGRAGLAVIAERSIHPLERLNLFDFQLGTISTEGVRNFNNNNRFAFKFSISARNQVPMKFAIVVWVQEVGDESVKKAAVTEESLA